MRMHMGNIVMCEDYPSYYYDTLLDGYSSTITSSLCTYHCISPPTHPPYPTPYAPHAVPGGVKRGFDQDLKSRVELLNASVSCYLP